MKKKHQDPWRNGFLSPLQLQILQYLQKYPLVDLSEGKGNARRSVCYLLGVQSISARRSIQRLLARDLISQNEDSLGRIIYRLTEKGTQVVELLSKQKDPIYREKIPLTYLDLLLEIESGRECVVPSEFLTGWGQLVSFQKDVEVIVRKKKLVAHSES